jgi:hypothetical protein
LTLCCLLCPALLGEKLKEPAEGLNSRPELAEIQLLIGRVEAIIG